MNDTNGTAASPESATTALAAAAGVAELASAVEIDAPEGEGLLAAFARHEVALGHRLAMRYAAALDAALADGTDDEAAARADLQAARFGGAVARVMGNVRLALVALAKTPIAEAEQWVP